MVTNYYSSPDTYFRIFIQYFHLNILESHCIAEHDDLIKPSTVDEFFYLKVFSGLVYHEFGDLIEFRPFD